LNDRLALEPINQLQKLDDRFHMVPAEHFAYVLASLVPSMEIWVTEVAIEVRERRESRHV